MPTYPDGFPVEVVELVRAASDRGVLCNRPSNGLEAVERFGAEHLATGDLIVYTSQDSVLQIAAHVDVVPIRELYEICAKVRATLPPEHAVGRVIARPFRGPDGGFVRTDGRRDFASPPPTHSYLELVQSAGGVVHSVGKVGQLFAGVGIDVEHPGATNATALDQTTELIAELPAGLRVHEPDRDRPGLRPPSRLRGLRRRAGEDRRLRRPLAGAAAGRRPARADRRPRL